MIGTGIGLGLAGYRLRTSFEAMPSLDLQFADRRMISAVLGPTPSFSRASTGTYFDGQGILQTAAVNGPRFNHVYNGTSWVSRGLLVEEQRTNLALNSEQFDNAAWTKFNSTVSSNSSVAPDGTTTADKVIPDTTNAFHGVYNSAGITVSNGTQYTASVYAKASGYNFLFLANNVFGVAGNYSISVCVNLTDGTQSNAGANGTYTVANVGNGWWRISCTGTASSTASYIEIWPRSTAGGASSTTGNGTDGALIWGVQLETGSFATSYTPTTTSSSVRSASVCQLAGTGFSGIWNSSEGTLVIEGDSVASGTTPFVCLDDNTSSERIEIYGSGTDPKILVVDGGSTQVDIDAGTISNGTAFKLAFAYKLNDFAVSLNGGAVATDTAGTLPTVDRLRIGSNQAGNYLNGHIARLRYYPIRLTNAKLQELST